MALYAVGDVFTFEVVFDKPVEVSTCRYTIMNNPFQTILTYPLPIVQVNKGLELALTNGGIAHYTSGSGKNMRFIV